MVTSSAAGDVEVIDERGGRYESAWDNIGKGGLFFVSQEAVISFRIGLNGGSGEAAENQKDIGKD